jgi:hypothetical protein
MYVYVIQKYNDKKRSALIEAKDVFKISKCQKILGHHKILENGYFIGS